MAFARSASGPAGLSINTGAANTFGSTSTQPPAAGGLFGAASATQPSTQTNSLFGNTSNTSQAPQAGSLFGAPPNNNQQQPQQQQPGGGLFGSNMASKPLFGGAATGATGGGGGLFGSAATSQPAQGGTSLFGSTTTQQQPATGATGGGGLFGQKPAGSLFGGTTANTGATGATGATGGFFGGSTANTGGNGTTGTTGGLFGNSMANTGAMGASGATGGLFGQSAAPAKSFFPSLNQQPAMSQQPAMPTLGMTMGPQVVPGVRIDLSNLRNTTRFNDLQEDLQKQIASMDTLIQNCMTQKEQVDAFIPQHEKQLESIPDDVRFVSRKYAAVDSALGADLQAIRHLRDQARVDDDEARLSMTAIQNLALPSQYHVSPGFLGSSTRTQQRAGAANGDGFQSTEEDLVSYFSRATDEMDEQIKKLQKTVRELDSHLGGVEQNINEQASRLQASNGTMGGGGQDDRLVELYHVLRDFEEGIMQVATVVGGAREGVTELQMNDFRGRGLLGTY